MIISLLALQSLLDDFVGKNVDTTAWLVESAGRFLYLLPETAQRMQNMLEVHLFLHIIKDLTTCILAASNDYVPFGQQASLRTLAATCTNARQSAVRNLQAQMLISDCWKSFCRWWQSWRTVGIWILGRAWQWTVLTWHASLQRDPWQSAVNNHPIDSTCDISFMIASAKQSWSRYINITVLSQMFLLSLQGHMFLDPHSMCFVTHSNIAGKLKMERVTARDCLKIICVFKLTDPAGHKDYQEIFMEGKRRLLGEVSTVRSERQILQNPTAGIPSC